MRLTSLLVCRECKRTPANDKKDTGQHSLAHSFDQANTGLQEQTQEIGRVAVNRAQVQ